MSKLCLFATKVLRRPRSIETMSDDLASIENWSPPICKIFVEHINYVQKHRVQTDMTGHKHNASAKTPPNAAVRKKNKGHQRTLYFGVPMSFSWSSCCELRRRSVPWQRHTGASNVIKNIWELTVQEQRACYPMKVPWGWCAEVSRFGTFCCFFSMAYWKEAGSSCTCSMDCAKGTASDFQYIVCELLHAYEAQPLLQKTLCGKAQKLQESKFTRRRRRTTQQNKHNLKDKAWQSRQRSWGH